MELIWEPCRDFALWIGSVKYTDTLSDLTKVFDLTKFGDAIVESPENIKALVTIQDVLLLYKSNIMKSTVSVSEIGTDIVAVQHDSGILHALRVMFQKGVRRVFLEDERKNSAFSFVSSRHILRFLFSPARLEMAKTNPESWVDARLSEVGWSDARVIRDGKTINQAAREIGNQVDDCLVCEPTNMVVSRWDLVMKPWKMNSYSFRRKKDS
jgi:hypothetical protein